MLMSALVGLRYLDTGCTTMNNWLILQTSELSVAETLKLPYHQGRKGWSWAEIGFNGIHECVARNLTPLPWTAFDNDVNLSPSPASDSQTPVTTSSSFLTQNMLPNIDQVAFTGHLHPGSSEVDPGVHYSFRLPSQIIQDTENTLDWNAQRHIDKFEAECHTFTTRVRQQQIAPKPNPHSESAIEFYYNTSSEPWQQQTLVTSNPSVEWAENILSTPAPDFNGPSIRNHSYNAVDRMPVYERLFLSFLTAAVS